MMIEYILPLIIIAILIRLNTFAVFIRLISTIRHPISCYRHITDHNIIMNYIDFQ
jgi:hypothetical protein